MAWQMSSIHLPVKIKSGQAILPDYRWRTSEEIRHKIAESAIESSLQMLTNTEFTQCSYKFYV